ncbi:hypothetical protein BGW42_008235 [Actinomortierella wolfii]|nr:hypothetical protein BGW42_008235 [Actinomortierella wolfii]
MAFFKINKKNKTASAASTPAQTPRASMQDERATGSKNTITVDQAMDLVFKNSYGSVMPMGGSPASTGPSIL